MSARKHTKLHDKWHRRVEGQIRHVIGQHPEWFTFTNPGNKSMKNSCVNALAKRIVGEIVADAKLASMPDGMTDNCSISVGNGSASTVPPSGRQDDSGCLASGNP